MKVVKEEFLNALKRVMPGIATGTPTMEGADNFIFHNNSVYTYNATVSAMTPIEGELGLEGSVKAVDFYECVAKMPSDFEIEVSDKVWTLKCGKIKVKVNLLTDVNSVLDRFEQLVPTDNWIDIPDNEVYNGFVQCYMTKNTTRYAGIMIVGNRFISTDGLQINRFETKIEYPTMWISTNAVGEILKWTDFTKIQLNKTWLQFSNGNVIFSVKTLFNNDVATIVGKIEKGLEKVREMEVIVEGEFNTEAFDAIDRAKTFSQNVMEKDSVIITFDKTDIIISSKRASGEFNEGVDIGTNVEEPVSCALALNMISDVSKYYKNFKLLKDPSNPPRLMFENDSAIHVVATLKQR